MEVARISEAAHLLLEARRSGKPLSGLPPHCMPNSAAEVNEIIDAVSTKLNEPVAGWKIAFLYRPREVPIRAPLYRPRVFGSPAEVPMSLVPSLRLEPEITFRLTHDLPPRAASYRCEEVAEAVVACPSLEVVDTRFDTRQRSLRQMLDERTTLLEAFSDHITTGAFVVGEAVSDWRDFDFATMRVVMRNSNRVYVETIGGHPFVDPFLPCVVLANELRHRDGLRAGQILASSSFSGFFEVEADQSVVATFEGFGSVECIMASALDDLEGEAAPDQRRATADAGPHGSDSA